MFDIGNFFAIKKAKKSAKDGTGGGSGDKNLPFMTVMFDGDGAGGVDRDVVRNVVKMEVSGCEWRRRSGWRRSDGKEVRSGEVSERVVEEVGDVGFAGGEEGGGKVSVGLTLVEFAGKGLRSSSQMTTALVARIFCRGCRGVINERPGIL